jgi:hypothetical protein
MATEPDPQESEQEQKPARSRKRNSRAGSSNGASDNAGDLNGHSGNGMLDDAHLPPPAEDDTPSSGMQRVNVPPPPGGYVSPNPPAPQPAAPAPVYYVPPASTPIPAPRQSGGFGRFLARLFGWLVAAVFGLGIGLLIFALAPVGFRQVIAPVTENTEDISRLDSQMGDLSQQIGDIQAEQLDQDRALIDAQTSADQRLAETEGRLADTEARLHDAEDALAEQTRMIQDLEDTLDQQSEQLDSLNATLAELQDELPGQAEYNEYNRQLLLMRAWQELLRARLRLLENNPGAALDELAAARATLDQAMTVSDADQQAALSEVTKRVDMVIDEITSSPFAATGDLEIAWQALGAMITPPGILPAVPAGTGTPTPTGEPTVEATATP